MEIFLLHRFKKLISLSCKHQSDYQNIINWLRLWNLIQLLRSGRQITRAQMKELTVEIGSRSLSSNDDILAPMRRLLNGLSNLGTCLFSAEHVVFDIKGITLNADTPNFELQLAIDAFFSADNIYSVSETDSVKGPFSVIPSFLNADLEGLDPDLIRKRYPARVTALPFFIEKSPNTSPFQIVEKINVPFCRSRELVEMKLSCIVVKIKGTEKEPEFATYLRNADDVFAWIRIAGEVKTELTMNSLQANLFDEDVTMLMYARD